MKKLQKKRDLEKKLLLKSETLRRLDLAAVTGGEPEGLCFPKTECFGACTMTYALDNG